MNDPILSKCSAPPAYVLTYTTADRNTFFVPIVYISYTDNASTLYM